ncbi:MAG: methionine aminotransferase [Candidatus Schekmanbacteria bacterium RBG_13_48_7]|uniref:Methionine aminotransferase n=1 Tax=Candidatus Schekmanbacteria bacterium RBG_13_48_7 TaxID=1817878 RepID=A0A1F7RRF5_9BACT|nr:MAG: methionine aminotransferase [Candidatus Schekmanbacteria bacterium RBG_13_48_7]
MKLESKLPQVGVTIFTVMTDLSNRYDAINLSQGFPDFDVHPELVKLVLKYMNSGKNQYAPMPGVMELRNKISQKIHDLYGAVYSPEKEITVTSGATESLFIVIATIIRPDDEVIIFEPAYDAYLPVVRLFGGNPRFMQLKPPGYQIDWNEVKDKISSKTKLIIINSPHNPTGSVLIPEDISALIELTNGTDVLILSDEVYEHIIYDGLKHESMCRYPELRERSFVISSFGKTYHTTGWKIGYCSAPESLTNEFRRIKQFTTFATNTPIQYAYSEFLDRKELYLNLPDFYQKKRDTFLSLMESSRFTALSCHGTYFNMMGYSSISDESDIEFSKRLIIEHGVAAIPPSVFYNDGKDYKTLRFCFAKKDQTLEKAAERLCKI